MKKKLRITTLHNTQQLWKQISKNADFNSSEYDKDMLHEIREGLGFEEDSNIRKELAEHHTSPEQLLAVLKKTLKPFSIMLNDLLKMFEAAKAQYVDDNIQIYFDFEKAKENFHLDLNHFRVKNEKVDKAINYEVRLDDCNPWKEFVDPLKDITGMDYPSTYCNAPPSTEEISKWLKDYWNTQMNWPDWFPKPPQSGVEKIDELIEDIWELPKAAIELYRQYYSAESERSSDLPRQSEDRTSAFYSAETDYWIGNYIEYICLLTAKVKDEREYSASIQSYEKALETFRKSLPLFKNEVENYLDILNLPEWKRRHALYSAWVSTQIVSAFDEWTVQYNAEDRILSFSFGGSIIAYLKYYDFEAALYAELRTPSSALKDLIKARRSRKNSIQPDYSLCVNDASDPQNTVLVIECKQYKRASKTNFNEAIIDYAAGRPNAQVILVNYTDIPTPFRRELSDEVRNRVPYYGKLFPSEEENKEFKKAVRNAFMKDCRIALSWGRLPTDLDIKLEITDPENHTTRIDYKNMGDPERYPFAALDKDDRSGYGLETITARILPAHKYDVFVHNYSGQKPDGEITVTIQLGRDTVKKKIGTLPDVKDEQWHVFSFDFCSISEVDRMVPEKTVQ